MSNEVLLVICGTILFFFALGLGYNLGIKSCEGIIEDTAEKYDINTSYWMLLANLLARIKGVTYEMASQQLLKSNEDVINAQQRRRAERASRHAGKVSKQICDALDKMTDSKDKS